MWKFQANCKQFKQLAFENLSSFRGSPVLTEAFKLLHQHHQIFPIRFFLLTTAVLVEWEVFLSPSTPVHGSDDVHAPAEQRISSTDGRTPQSAASEGVLS